MEAVLWKNLLDYAALSGYATEVLNWPEENENLSEQFHTMFLTKSQLDELETRQVLTKHKLVEHSEDLEYNYVVLSDSPANAWAVLNRVHQKGLHDIGSEDAKVEIYLLTLRLKKGRMADLLKSSAFRHFDLLGLRNVASDHELTLSALELNSCALIKFDIPLKQLHDQMRSDAVFATGHVRAYGVGVSPMTHLTPIEVHNDCKSSLTYQTLSATGDRAEIESDDFEHDIERALTYARENLWSDADAKHLMPTPSCILKHAPLNIRRAHELVFDVGSDRKPIFASDFDAKKFNEAVEQNSDALTLSCSHYD